LLQAVFGQDYLRDFEIRLPDGTTLPSISGERAFTFVVNTPGALRAAFTPPFDLNAGTAFVDGAIDVEGDLPMAIARLNRAGSSRTIFDKARIARALHRLPSENHAPDGALLQGKMHSRERDRAAISYHYDLPPEFYQTFLDRDLVYSCAYYDDGIDGLDDAQSAKLDHVLRKLRLRSGMRFLDIGCGWGSLVIRAAQRGAEAVGITLSPRQFVEANRRISAAGLQDRARVLLCDYRDLKDVTFDRIASIGMVEHVGRTKLREYFQRVWHALAPQGLFLNHGIAEQSPGRNTPTNPFIRRYVFPDGDLVAVSDANAIAERAGFEVRDVENLRDHYAKTLRAWVTNLEAHRDAAIALAGVTAYRIWRLYMAASAVSFENASIGVYQSLLAKPGNDGRVTIPPTRRDLYG
jgi:cyclopropane-fatty-acyl-phospholipid synthase